MRLQIALALSVTVLVAASLRAQQNQKDDGQKNQIDNGQQNQKDDGQVAQVVVKNVDVKNNVLTAKILRKGKEFILAFPLDKKVAVRVGNKKATLAALKPQMMIAIRFAKDKKTAVEIRQIGNNQKDDGQQNQNNNGQQNQNNNGQQNQNNNGQQNQNNNDQQNQNNNGQQNQNNNGQQNQK